jgi:hypothetical protein
MISGSLFSFSFFTLFLRSPQNLSLCTLFSRRNSAQNFLKTKIMDTDRIVEKIYCGDRGNGNDAWLAASMNNQNQWMNNPFAYLIFMQFARYFNGNENGADFNSRQIAALQDSVNTNHANSVALQAINGNEQAIRELATLLNSDFNTLQQCCCDMRAAIREVGGQVGFSAERVINAVNLGDCNIIQALKDCCCTTQKSILEMGYQNQLANERQTNVLQNEINRVSVGMERGFSASAFETKSQTCEILNAQERNTQRIIDALNNHWTEDLRTKYQDAKCELSQIAQTSALTNQLNAIAAAIAKIPTT